jgi:hypothetical protein
MSSPGSCSFDHIERMSDERGLFEHADGTSPRREHGYCTDDNARLLVVTTREPNSEPAKRLGRLALGFVLDAQGIDGRSRNRMDRLGRWTDVAGTDDCWGRSVWALGAAATQHADPSIRSRAMRGFDNGVRERSPWPRSMAFAALGAADVLAHDAHHGAARALLVDALDVIEGEPATRREWLTSEWMWPESRLSYANAALAEAVISAGAALRRPADLEIGLGMLTWLLDRQTRRGHLSVSPVAGDGPDDRGPRFDQQPIEVAALADACWRAYSLTGDHRWSVAVATAAAWFAGANDTGMAMTDDASGGGYDGLQVDSVNVNQGAESTLAFISTMQRARSFIAVPR